MDVYFTPPGQQCSASTYHARLEYVVRPVVLPRVFAFAAFVLMRIFNNRSFPYLSPTFPLMVCFFVFFPLVPIPTHDHNHRDAVYKLKPTCNHPHYTKPVLLLLFLPYHAPSGKAEGEHRTSPTVTRSQRHAPAAIP